MLAAALQYLAAYLLQGGLVLAVAFPDTVFGATGLQERI